MISSLHDRWQQCIGIIPSPVSVQDKHTFIKNFFSQRPWFSPSPEQFIRRLITPHKERAEIYQHFRSLATHTLQQSAHNERLQEWVNTISSQEQLEVFVQELFQHCHCIDDLKPLSSLSSQQRRDCLSALRDRSIYGQLRAACTSLKGQLPLIALTTLLFPGIVALTHLTRYLCFEIESLLECDPLALSTSAIIAPIIEEVIFRTLLQTGIKSALSHCVSNETVEIAAVILTAIIFGLAHFYNPHDLIEQNVCHFINCTLGGIVLGLIYERYGLIASATSHTLFNTTLLTIESLICSILPLQARIGILARRSLL